MMKMQHFLLSAASRTLSLKAMYQIGEDKAYQTFCQLRWDNGEATCPRCGCCDTYGITTRRKFKCKGCNYQFSVTSGTIFASRKMSFTDLLTASITAKLMPRWKAARTKLSHILAACAG